MKYFLYKVLLCFLIAKETIMQPFLMKFSVPGTWPLNCWEICWIVTFFPWSLNQNFIILRLHPRLKIIPLFICNAVHISAGIVLLAFQDRSFLDLLTVSKHMLYHDSKPSLGGGNGLYSA